jgi:hypothetical protein
LAPKCGRRSPFFSSSWRQLLWPRPGIDYRDQFRPKSSDET